MRGQDKSTNGTEDDTCFESPKVFLFEVLALLVQRYPLLTPLAHLTLHTISFCYFLVVIAV